ncbi:hypothetical protein QLX08_009063 [Tetragonisca angustula]|uniref:CCHC-type domain-containing protein n=1 Tax=Tetragonisca angustula TaxID=166442 RepID=A0AAW0ZJ13_9HYME
MTDLNKNVHKSTLASPNSKNPVSAEKNSREKETLISTHDTLMSELIEKNLMKLWKLTENIKNLNEEIRMHSSESNVKEIIAEKSKKIAASLKFLFRTLKESTEMNEQNKIKKSSVDVSTQVFLPSDYQPITSHRPSVNSQSTSDSFPMPSNAKSLPKQLCAQALDKRPKAPKKSLSSKTFESRDNISHENEEQISQKSILKHSHEQEQITEDAMGEVIPSRRKKKIYSPPIKISENQNNIPHCSKEQIIPLSNIINHLYKQFPEFMTKTERMKKINRSGAIVIIPIGREVKGTDFKDTCRMVLSKAKDKLNCTTKIRKTQDGYLLIELKKDTNVIKTATEIQTIVGDDFKVKPLVDKIFIEIRDLDPIISKEKIKSILMRILHTKQEENVMVRQLSTAWRGTQRAIIELTVNEFKKLQRIKKFKIDMIHTTWREVPMVTRCYKCHHFGHIANKCKMTFDAIECCRRCGKVDHQIKSCRSRPCCAICRDEGKKGEDLKHVAGSIRCPAYRRLTNEASQKQKLINTLSSDI